MYRDETRILDDIFSFLTLERLYRSVSERDREQALPGLVANLKRKVRHRRGMTQWHGIIHNFSKLV